MTICVMKTNLLAIFGLVSVLNLQSSVLVLASSLDFAEAWVQRYDGPGNGSDRATAMGVDLNGNVYVTGDSTASRGLSADWATVAYSSAGLPLWTNRYNGPGNFNDFARAMAVDASGNVIVTGWSDGGESAYDFATIKYSSAGIPLWTNRYSGWARGQDYARAVAVDAGGNVAVTGSSDDGGGLDYATIKYSSAGVALWTNRYGGLENYHDMATALAVDRGGNVIVTGSSYNGANDDYVTVKYSSSGVPLWTNRENGPANGMDAARGVAVDASGNVVVTGAVAARHGRLDYATIKYSSAGVLLWINHYNGPGNGDDMPCTLAVDASGDVLVTGYSAATNVFPGDEAYTTIKYSSTGAPLWTNRYHGPGKGEDHANGVGVDARGNVYVTGCSTGGGSRDYATIKYSSAGLPLWTNRYNGPGNGPDAARALAVDVSGNVYVTGPSTGIGGGFDYATIKYAPPVPAQSIPSHQPPAALTHSASPPASLPLPRAGDR